MKRNLKTMILSGCILFSIVPACSAIQIKDQNELINQLTAFQSPKEIIPGERYIGATKEIVKEFDIDGEFRRDLKTFIKYNGCRSFHGNMKDIDYFIYKIDHLIYVDFTNNTRNVKNRKIIIRNMFFDFEKLKEIF